MLAAHLPPTDNAPADPHVVWCHLRAGAYGQLGHIRIVDTLRREGPAACGARIHEAPDVHRRLGELCRPWALAVAEGASARLAPRRLGVGHPSAFGQWHRLSFPAPCELFDLRTQ